MRVDLFDFTLPPGKIAQRPISPRHAARLLTVKGNSLSDKHVYDLPKILHPGDLLIFNNTKVIAAALQGRARGQFGEKKIHVNLHKQEDATSWWAFAKPAKHVREGETLHFADDFTARIAAERPYGERLLQFAPSVKNASELRRKLEAYGNMPLPPYIKRSHANPQDKQDYQTIFAEHAGAVAAPTAGLHFSESLLESLQKAGVEKAFVTLHVGGGTFLPLRGDDTDEHKMHSEYGTVSQDTCDKIVAVKNKGGRIIAVGTTSLRILETAALQHGGTAQSFNGETDIFITPGFQFAVADLLLTNFHLPRTTLLMLVAAFAGLAEIKAAYAHAIAEDYRFFSYGDACLLERHDAI